MSKIHFIGDCGASMSVLKALTKAAGHTVTGSDLLHGGHNADNVVGADKVIYTCATSVDNVELRKAYELNIPTVERSVYLSELAKNYKDVIAISGSHGKTTSTAILGTILQRYKPTLHFGGTLNGKLGCKIGSKNLFITEACEYRRSFLTLNPYIIGITNIDYDHVDYFIDEKDYINAFIEFTNKTPYVVCSEDTASKLNCNKKFLLIKCLTREDDCIDKYAISVKIISNYLFKVYEYGIYLGEIKHNLLGEFNIENAIIAIAISRFYGICFSDIQNAFNKFKGVDRRFQYLDKKGSCHIITDYAHHPSQIKVTLQNMKKLYDYVIAVFQPHTYSRLKAMANEFANALLIADEIYILPVYSAREKPIKGVDNNYLVNLCKNLGADAKPLNSIKELKKSNIKNSAIIYLSAGLL